MARRTRTKFLRMFDLKHFTGSASETTKDGKIPLLTPIRRDEVLPAEPRKERIVMCGSHEVKVMVSEGQIINEHRICKNYYKNQS